MLQINQMKVDIDVLETELLSAVSRTLRTPASNIISYDVLRRSIDARKKENIQFVYNVVVKVKDEHSILNKKLRNVQSYVEKESRKDYSDFKFDKNKKIAIVGFGPAGMFSALAFAEAGVNVTVFERGEKVDDRIKTIDEFVTTRKLNPESNIQFGEGGAGTFSDGKLTNRKKDIRGKWLFEKFVEAGAPKEILYVHNPHIGTDKLVDIVKSIRGTILSSGSTIKFNSKVTDIIKSKNGIEVTVNGVKEDFDYVVLAIGHSSRDTIEMLYNNQVDIVQKPFAVGFRIEHRQSMINKSQFGPSHNNERLGAADYKLTHQTKNNKGVYTFCMCPGGLVVPASSEEGMLVVNGMSEYKRDKVNANSALLVTVDGNDFGSEHPLAGIEYQRKLEKKAFEMGGSNYNAPIQTVGDYINNVTTTKLGEVLPSYSVGITYSNLREVFSKSINEAFIEAFGRMGNKLKGFSNSDALLTGVESRSSSPVRINRDRDSMQSTNVERLYPIGEGAGYAGGIVSAAIDGIKVAETIMEELIKK